MLCECVFWVLLFFFKQKTAYEVRISDWSSDVCSSDLSRRSCLHGVQRVAQHRDPRKLGLRRREATAAVRWSRHLALGPMDRHSFDHLLVGPALSSYPTSERDNL